MGKDGETDEIAPPSNTNTAMDAPPSQSTTTNTTPTTDTDNNDSRLNAINGSEASMGINLSTAELRLKELERLFLGGPTGGLGPCYSMETLLDVLLVLYDECINSSMRREKTVSDFIEYGEYNRVS